MEMRILTDWAEWAIGLAFWLSVSFVPIVSFFWRWWKDSWGWNIVLLEVTIALALLRTTLIVEFGLLRSGMLVLWLTDAAVSLVPIIITWRIVLILQGQYRGARKRPLRVVASLKELDTNGVGDRTGD